MGHEVREVIVNLCLISFHSRQKELDAIAEARGEGKTEVVDECELPKLLDDVNVKSVYERQRWNMFRLAYRTGLRAETLMRLKWRQFQMEQLEGGKKLLRVVLSTMKNHQATYDKLDRSLLDKIIVQCEDARYGHFTKPNFF